MKFSKDKHEKLQQTKKKGVSSILLKFFVMIIYMLIFVLWLVKQRDFAYSDQQVIACTNTAAFWLSGVPLFIAILFSIIQIDNWYDKRKQVQTQEKSQRQRPVKSQRLNSHRISQCPQRKNTHSQRWKVGIAVFLGILCFLASYYPRTVLTASGDIMQYSIINHEKTHISVSDYTDVQLAVTRHNGGRHSGPHYYIEITIKTKNDSFRFESYRNIEAMLAFLDSLTSKSIVLGDTQYYDKYKAAHEDLTNSQIRRLDAYFCS